MFVCPFFFIVIIQFCLFVFVLSGNDEVSSIQSQLNSLKLNPYPELKVVSESNEATSPAHTVNQQQPSFNDDLNSSSTLNAKEISNCLSEVELAGASTSESSTYQQSPHASLMSPSTNSYLQRQQPQLDAAAATTYQQQQQLCQNDGPIGFNAQQLQQHQAQQFLAHSQQTLHPINPHGYQNGSIQQQQQPTNMAMQFMQAMQQSVSQVANAPHFGYEWVKPNYQFDPLTTFYDSEQSLNGKNMPLLKNSTMAETPPLTDGDMDELYEALDEYTGKDLVEERILQEPNVHQHLYHE
jgi:hypothetical protein